VPLTPQGFLPLIATDLEDYSGTVGVRGEFAGWRAELSAGEAITASTMRWRNSINTSFGTQSQRTFNAGGLRYGQNIFNLDFSREMPVGFAKPLSVAVGAEYREEQFEIRPGELQSFATGPLFRGLLRDHRGKLHDAAGVFNATTGICSFPGRAAPAGRRVSRASRRTAHRRGPPQLRCICRARH
jgi:iron complex outermembrane receptor protein